ncbi:TetR/AcrR family transcriptional regulator [Marinibacterium sp. SX1]|uniref:TetR/AcrR family transcriptional regulator n=1 Tax=Marinibacterium sp. SX1 TaxID=3388424 RepID=UPI003D16C1C2
MTEKSPGRPRDAGASARLKATALRLVRERGYAAVSISAIIAEAGVSRQTLYNRWKTKAELVLDAFHDDSFAHVPAPVADPDHHTALLRFLEALFVHLARDGDTLRAVIAAAQEDPAFRATFRDRFVLPREAIVTELLQEAQASGELAADRDTGMLSAFIHGAFWYRLLNDQPLDAALARRITDEAFRA